MLGTETQAPLDPQDCRRCGRELSRGEILGYGGHCFSCVTKESGESVRSTAPSAPLHELRFACQRVLRR